ncbi:monooxygenase family protein, partial [Bacteroidota bacterium]
MQIFNGKYTSKPENSFVVFIFGMRINNFLFLWLWIPFFIRLVRIVKRLRKYKESGMLNAHLIITTNGIGVIQYWESFDKLEKFALDKNDMHVPNRIKYGKSVGKSGIVGIW